MARIEGNFLEGKAVPSHAGTFELRSSLNPGESLGQWPQSGPEDLLAALAGLRRGREQLAGIPTGARRRWRDAAFDSWSKDETSQREVAAALGLSRQELLRAEARAHAAAEQRSAAASGSGIAWIQHAWHGLRSAPFLALADALERGDGALCLSDPRLPQASEAAVRAFLAAGVPELAIALVHAPLGESSAEFVKDACVSWVEASGSLAQMERLARAMDGRATPCATRLRPARCGSRRVLAAGDLAVQAQEIVAGAFGRWESLGGQQDGALSHVLCDARVFSRFTAELLTALEASAAWSEPLPLIDAEARGALQSLWSLGLDEGATPIAGARSCRVGAVGARRALPTVFTNADARMQIVTRVDPAPVLALLRG